jgi:hypothetical protein
MGSIDTFKCGCIESPGLERLRYFPRQLLTADDMRVEQDYFREKQRRHNRFLHGWGVVCGLLVQPNPTAGPLVVTVCPGYALGPCGDEIYVPDPVDFDLTPITQQLAQPSCANPGMAAAFTETGLLSLVIRYAECQTRPVRTLPAGCACDDSACEFSRIRDGFEIRCIAQRTVSDKQAPPTLCEINGDITHQLPPMPAAPSSDWVQLASIQLVGGGAGKPNKLDAQSINNNMRRLVFSTAQIQQQVIACCC